MTSFKILVVFLLALPSFIIAQLVKENEVVIYTFTTKGNKKMALVKDKNDNYIQYRFGTDRKIELEYPSTQNKESWSEFSLSTYYRGGGKQNAGMTLKYLHFFKNNIRYSIYNTYHAEDAAFRTGILVRGENGKEIADIKGIYSTVKGNLLEVQGKVSNEDYGF